MIRPNLRWKMLIQVLLESVAYREVQRQTISPRWGWPSILSKPEKWSIRRLQSWVLPWELPSSICTSRTRALPRPPSPVSPLTIDQPRPTRRGKQRACETATSTLECIIRKALIRAGPLGTIDCKESLRKLQVVAYHLNRRPIFFIIPSHQSLPDVNGTFMLPGPKPRRQEKDRRNNQT